MRMKYRPYKTPEDRLLAGDVRRCTIYNGELTESFYAILIAISSDSVLVRRLFKDNGGTSRYLIREVGPTGLEYAMFVDTRDMTLPIAKVGRKVGKVSKTDMRNIRL